MRAAIPAVAKTSRDFRRQATRVQQAGQGPWETLDNSPRFRDGKRVCRQESNLPDDKNLTQRSQRIAENAEASVNSALSAFCVTSFPCRLSFAERVKVVASYVFTADFFTRSRNAWCTRVSSESSGWKVAAIVLPCRTRTGSLPSLA